MSGKGSGKESVKGSGKGIGKGVIQMVSHFGLCLVQRKGQIGEETKAGLQRLVHGNQCMGWLCPNRHMSSNLTLSMLI